MYNNGQRGSLPIIIHHRGVDKVMSVHKGANKRAANKERLVPVTVRFTRTAYDAIQRIGHEHGMTMATTVRMAVDMNFKRYLRNIRFVDYDQGKEILSEITSLFNECSEIGFQLKRIGVNYNQVVRLRNMEKAYKANMAKAATFDERAKAIKDRDDEKKAIEKECKALDMDKLEELISRYETATAKVSELLCPILQ